jgi:hypothetical protein
MNVWCIHVLYCGDGIKIKNFNIEYDSETYYLSFHSDMNGEEFFHTITKVLITYYV